MLQLPIYRGFMFVQQYFVGAGEMPAPEECTACKRTGMSRLQNEMSGSVYQLPFIAGEASPKEEDYAIAII